MDAQNEKFSTMLKGFQEIIKESPAVEKVKDNLLGLKTVASNDVVMNGRQREAIVARCDNYLNGRYGSTARLSH